METTKLSKEIFYYNEPIGFGSFSIIYRGKRFNSSRNLAVKRITKIIDKKYFNREIKLMKSFSHPNILKLYDFVKKDKGLFLILEYCESGDLSQYIKNKIYTYDDKYFYEIFNGLEYLFNNNILHRDIKPQNILITDNTIKISDFGFAKTFEKNELISTVCGSPLYMAPEIIKNKQYNHKSDIWSLGVIIFELFTKKHPYYTTSKKKLITNIKNGIKINYTFINDDKLINLLKKILNENPEKRISWDNLFNEFHNYKDKKRKMSFEQDLLFDMDLDFDYNKNITNSVVFKKNKQNDLSTSLNLNEFNEIKNYEDCKIISRSAPNKLGRSYLKNYIINKKSQNKNNDMPILAKTPPINNSGIFGSLSKSIKSYLNF
mgnify:FL=1|tara:strand:+ start:3381 stop:4505 length:1125 start_codon:yes stop_codon:yes gene_type:complete